MLKGIGGVSATITAGDQFTTDTNNTTQASTGTAGMVVHGFFNVSVGGTWVGTVTVQRSFDSGATWNDINKYTANVENWDQEIEAGVLYRIGMKSADYTSGSANVRISR